MLPPTGRLPNNFAGYGPKVAMRVKLVITDYQQFMADPDSMVSSDAESIFGLHFHGEMRHVQEATGRKLQCSLVCTFPARAMHCYNVAVRTHIRLHRQLPVQLGFELKSHLMGHQFSKDCNRWMHTIDADSLVGPLIGNLSGTVEIELRQGIPFRQPWRDFTRRNSAREVCITASGSPERLFHVDPDFMAYVSPYFAKSLYPDGGTAVNLQLDGVDPADVEVFLKALHGLAGPINAENVAVILPLSVRFEVATLRQKCEEFLTADTSVPMARKVWIADRTSPALRSYLMAKLTFDDCIGLNRDDWGMQGLSHECHVRLNDRLDEIL